MMEVDEMVLNAELQGCECLEWMIETEISECGPGLHQCDLLQFVKPLQKTKRSSHDNSKADITTKRNAVLFDECTNRTDQAYVLVITFPCNIAF